MKSKYLLSGIILLGIIGVIFISSCIKQEEKITALPQPLADYLAARECGNGKL